jgi:beta-lactam-binding protein with PASTA domain
MEVKSEATMRAFFRYVLLALVLVTVFLVSALTAMRLAIHGREAAVPKVTGLSPAEGQRIAVAAGLLFEVEDHFYSPEVPEGRILSQLPPPGTDVRRGWKLRVAESLGPQRVEIPDLIGQSTRAAEINLAQRGLQMGAEAVIHLPDVPPDQVLAQSPAPRAEGVASPKVNLLLTAPLENEPLALVMPDFVGRHYEAATSAIVEGGFKLGAVSVTLRPGSPLTSDKPNKLKPIATDIIIAQTPAAGQKVLAGAKLGFRLMR